MTLGTDPQWQLSESTRMRTPDSNLADAGSSVTFRQSPTHRSVAAMVKAVLTQRETELQVSP
jgi:hypothetical protein